MKPYYDEGGIRIYHGDCREVLPTLERADFAITDPPYNVGINYGTKTDDARDDYLAWCADWFGLLRERTSRVAVTPGIANVGMWWQIGKPDWVLAWHKPAAMGRCHVGFNNWEPVLYYGDGLSSGCDVIVAPLIPDAAVEGHPCPKPLKWAVKIIDMLAPKGATIIDPFMGSGTSMRAAKDLGLAATGIEIEERYCEIAANRLRQGVLFGGAA